MRVRFVVDAQLPPALARWLLARGHEATHVFDLDLAEATDRVIWSRAQAEGAVIITKDEDFVTLRALAPQGPAVVWVRAGNTTRAALLAWLEPMWPAIEQGLASGERLIEVT